MSDEIRVLHVDDEPDFTEMAGVFLEREDERITVETATGADEGLEILATDDIDCIVSDYDMPGRNGIEFLEAVRETRSELPFILYTGKGSEEIASDAVSAGVTDYLQKGTGDSQYTVLANRITNAVEQYRSRLAVEETERKLSEIAEKAEDILFMFDAEWSELLFVNSAYEDVWGAPISELEANPMSFLEYVHPEDRAQVVRTTERLSNGHETNSEYRIIRPDGEVRQVQAEIRPIRDENGEVVRIVGTARDITEPKTRQKELERHENVLRAAGDAVYSLDIDGRFLTVNEQFIELTGYDREELLGEHVSIMLDEEDLRRGREAIRELIRTEQTVKGHDEIIHTADGREIPVEVRITLLEDDDGYVRGTTGVLRDIRDRKERAQELERYERIFEKLNDAVYVLDETETIVYVNDRYAELKNIDREELLGTEISEVASDDAIERVRNARDRIQTGGREFELIEDVLTTAEGDEVPIEIRLTEIERADSTLERVGVIREISERKKRERELERQNDELAELNRKLEAQYRTLFEEAPIMAVVTEERDGKPFVEDCNSQFVETLGYERDSIIGRELSEFYTPNSVEELMSSGYRRSLEGDFSRERRELLTLDGEVIETLLRAVPRTDDDGEVTGTLAMYVDITEREEIKRANDRLEEFTSIVSHDLRNPLNVATGRLELVRTECDSEHLDDVERAHKRMQTLIDDLLSLAREGRTVTERTPVDIASLVEACWANVRTGDATLLVDIDRTVEADSDRLKQVFENLIHNAVEHSSTSSRPQADDAVEHGSTSNRTKSDDAVKHSSRDVTVEIGALEDGFYIEDDGPGIPEDQRERVFEAGYTTSDDGTGFGLSIVKRIIEAHGWEIDIADAASGGARFEVRGIESES